MVCLRSQTSSGVFWEMLKNGIPECLTGPVREKIVRHWMHPSC